jgi:hypothetical protein
MQACCFKTTFPNLNYLKTAALDPSIKSFNLLMAHAIHQSGGWQVIDKIDTRSTSEHMIYTVGFTPVIMMLRLDINGHTQQ